ncbi:RNA dependent RNA polymerase-domain-containing protein [Cercophora scortea]|uniref:RNA-directed RNA polymerase n=1 Tax=Cercophora scortea TaxID=314031 RepID=A0AAE0MLJ8_9PEZI|nr:RNA dependent RNA polymerase-domain-containing protein [Cercophora scortea]
MSAHHLARAAKPLARSVAGTAANPSSPWLRQAQALGRQRFTTSALRRALTGKVQNNGPGNNPGSGSSGSSGPRTASTWSLSTLFAVAATAGLAGWGVSELRHRGLPGSMLLDSMFPTPKYASLHDMELALDEIRKQLGGDDIISTDPDDLHAHGYSEWSTTNPEGLPVAVAYPRSTEQVSTIARVCQKYRVPIIPYSGGSSLEGNFSAPFGGISVDFAYMDQIVKFNKEDMDIVVQPSIGWQDLNEQLAKMGSGLFFPIDPGPSAKIGGMIGTNCSGTNAVKYGTMKDWVINLTVVLADGTVIKTRKRPRKSSAGYNLNGLFVGSEGTLGLVTEATLKLAVIPQEFSVAVVTFPTIRDAASAAAEVMQTGIPVHAMEIMDEVQMKVVNMGGATAPRVWKELPTLFFKFSGTKAGVKENISMVQKITKLNKGGNFEFAKDEREQKLLWSARKESLWSMLALRKDGEEVSKKEMDDLGLFASILGHVGDGNFHESIIYNRRDKAERAKVEACVKNMVKRALEMEGTCTGEHSIGWGKKESLLLEVGSDTLGVMKSIKSALDPNWIINKFRQLSRHFQRMSMHKVELSICLQWRLRQSVVMTLRGVPPNATPLDIWLNFSYYGNITYIDLDEPPKESARRTESARRLARVRFEPPPTNLSFVHQSKCRMIIASQESSPVVDFNTPTENKTFKTPLGNSCPISTVISPPRITFGVLTDTTVFMTKQAVQSLGPNLPLKLTFDFKKKRLVIHFPVRFESHNPIFQHPDDYYRMDVKFSIVKGIHRVDAGHGNFSLVMILDDPPPVWMMKRDPRSSFSPDRLEWKELDLWHRVVDISREPGSRRTEPFSLEDDYQVIDIGRWTTSLWIDLDQNTTPTWLGIETRLRDWNIKTKCTAFQLWLGFRDLALLETTPQVSLPFDVRYQLEVCMSHGILSEYNIERDFIDKLVELSDPQSSNPDRARLVLEYAADKGERIFRPMDLFEDSSAMSYYPTTVNIPNHCALVRRVEVTPTRIYFSTPTVETTNRVIRNFKHVQDRFIRIQFIDELSEGRINGCEADSNDELYNRAFQVLQRGFRMGRWHWKFLAFGNSQIRENGAFFFCEPQGSPEQIVTCDKIRSWMGRFSHIKVVAKYAARLGQCFSTTRPVPGISAPQLVKIPDVERGGHCFTDGVGKISSLLARMVAEDWKLDPPPSAYQFRMGGCKGVLVTWPDVKGKEVHIRKSQEKFFAEFNGLEVIRCSQYSCATLNRQTITILTCLGVPDEVFVDMMREQLSNYNDAMTDNNKAVHLLSHYVDENQTTLAIARMVLDGFMRTRDPFVEILLQLWRSWSIKSLREKARIVVEKGAFVLGCVDETGTLRGHSKSMEGQEKVEINQLPQIFLQVPDSDKGGAYKVMTGLCLVGRNPSLHPGDIRVVEAVDVPSLRHIRDVVVFPLTGDRDVPGMCSGGDLDGDDFFVIWDERLLPTEWCPPPMDYTPPEAVQEPGGPTADSLKSFFVLFMKNNNLPLIAHAHLATADFEKDGAKSENCLKLAELHSKAVDYVKTGVPAEWSKKLDPRRWPHFMEKNRLPYKSYKVLGELYDMVQKETFDTKQSYKLPFDKRILNRYTLDNSLLKKARQVKTRYDIAMRRVMGQLEINTEFEVWSAFVLSKPRVGSSYKIQEKAGQESAALKKQYRDLCIKESGGSRDFHDFGPFVAAMYRVTSEEVRIALHESRQAPRSMPLISFPWLFESVLGQIATGCNSVRPTIDVNTDADAAADLSLVAEDPDEINMDYTRTSDGQVIHRGEILHLFHHEEDEEDDEDDHYHGDGNSNDGGEEMYGSSPDHERPAGTPLKNKAVVHVEKLIDDLSPGSPSVSREESHARAAPIPKLLDDIPHLQAREVPNAHNMLNIDLLGDFECLTPTQLTDDQQVTGSTSSDICLSSDTDPVDTPDGSDGPDMEEQTVDMQTEDVAGSASDDDSVEIEEEQTIGPRTEDAASPASDDDDDSVEIEEEIIEIEAETAMERAARLFADD